MKKIGLVSCYFKHNYGSQLQAFALQEFLISKGFSVENIDISKLKDFSIGKKKYYKSKILDLNFVLSKIGMLNLSIRKKIINSNNFKIRENKFNEFKHNFNLSKKYSSYRELTENCMDRYTDIVVGSDQLWLPVNVVADFYTLNWVPNEINKISYSTSFGFSDISSKYKNQYENFLKRINHISVREDSGKELIQNNFNLNATKVCDPTLLLTCDEWLRFSGKERKIKEKYIFVYFLGKNKMHWDFVNKLKEKTGCKIVSLNHCDEFFKYADKCTDISLYDVNPFDFINLIHFAEYICTDSFHGTVFSIINNKQFFSFRRFSDKSKISTNSRVYSLLEKFELIDHLLFGNEKIEDILKLSINYSKVNNAINQFREFSINWLLNSISYKTTAPLRVDGFNKWECCGCGACANVCPTNAITMLENSEGFIHPSIDNSKCINCKSCVKVCAFNNEQKYDFFEQYGYVVQNKDKKILKESTSGGAFSAFAKSIIANGGVVYGVKLDDKFNALHVKATSVDELSYFRNSKYVQSNTNYTFKEVKDLLNKNIPVLYSGTICQIEGLISYLNYQHVNQNKLYTCEVICHDIVSPKVLKKYIDYQNIKQNGINKIVFRDKSIYGYDWSNLALYNNNKIKYHNGLDKDIYLKLMFDGTSIRKSCFSCSFKKQKRHSDITIWDCFDVRNYDSTMDNNKGATKVLINSKKGEDLFLQSKENLYSKEFSAYELIYNNYEMFNKPYENENRNNFFEDLNNYNEKKLFKKYGKISLKNKFVDFIKKILIRINCYSLVKSKKMKNRK